MTESHSDLSPELTSALLRLLARDDADYDAGLCDLLRRNPEHEAALRAAAADARAGQKRLRDDKHHEQAPARAKSPGHSTADPVVGTEIGRFKVLERLGEGGMGAVYLAEQRQPMRRRVAIKVIKLGMDTKAVLARFAAERQALAMMTHSNIAKVLEAGATPDGKPYFAMEYVSGIPITEYCDQHTLSIEERLRLFQQVCSGVQHAHAKGVIHRDLTPNNILVTTQDGQATAKIIDFGLARATDHRLTERTLFTEHGVFAGTPEYMSPEQAGLDGLDIDTRSDVYTLGALLYELLTGGLPFLAADLRKAGYDGIRRIIREQSPPKPSTNVTTRATSDLVAKARRTDTHTLLKRLRGDLDWVVMKCLEKDRTRRYETVSQLGEDIQRHLDHEPVAAHAPSLGYRAKKLALRYRTQLVAAAMVVGALVVGLVGTTWFAFEAKAHEKVAKDRADEAEASKRDFDHLAAVARLRQLIDTEGELHPAWPERIVAFHRWSGEADQLRALRPEVLSTVQSLRVRASPLSAAEIERDQIRHPRYIEWLTLRAKVPALAKAHAIRTGEQVLSIPRLLPQDRALSVPQLNELAWARVADVEGQRTWGDEANGLALALLAWEKAQSHDDATRANQADTLAWAWFANGKDVEALAMGRRALELSNDANQKTQRAALASLQASVDAAFGEAGRTALRALQSELDALTTQVAARRTYRVDASTQVLHDQLTQFLTDLDDVDARRSASVARRLGWAERIDDWTRNFPGARVTWNQARDAILRADGTTASEIYANARIDLQPQIGLVPIGMNPVTKLWEFYHLRSAWDGRSDPRDIVIPQHITNADRCGHIDVTQDTGIVFVLLPGGEFVMGAQTVDASAPLHDPNAQPSEILHAVRLNPFFIARHEVTQAQWRRLTGDTPSDMRAANTVEQNYITWANPVESLDWFAARLGLTRHGLVLPSQAQWEYACRATTTTPWMCEKSQLVRCANLKDASMPAHYGAAESWDDHFATHAPVGTFAANLFGVFDMHGNVAEWTNDGTFLGMPAPGDGAGDLHRNPEESRLRDVRGGSYGSFAVDARASRSTRVEAHTRGNYLGVRAARRVYP